MRGSIIKRATGSWTIILDLGRDPTTGKRRQQWHTVKGTKREAEAELAKLVHSIDTGGYVKPDKLTMGEYLKGWVETYAWPNLAPKTAQNYEHMVNKHLVPALGAVQLGQVRAEHVQRYLADKLASGLSAKTVRHHYVTLHTALSHAVKHGTLGRNPCDTVTPPRPRTPEMRVLDWEGIARVLEASRATDYHALFHFLLDTGARRSESLALRWSDVDLLLCQVSINRSLHQLRDRSIVFRPPKTARSTRMIALTPSLALVLREHREQQEAIKATLGLVPAEDDLVFSHHDGSPYLPDTITHAWLKLVRRLGLEGVRLHDARHTHATVLLKGNVSPKVVSERLGHSTVSLTLDVYSHVIPGLQEAAAARLDVLLGRTLRLATPASRG
jgi:integrase